MVGGPEACEGRLRALSVRLPARLSDTYSFTCTVVA